MVAAGTSQPSFVEGIREGVRAYLRFWSGRPDAARAWTLEVMAAGSEALAHRETHLRSFRACTEPSPNEHGRSSPGCRPSRTSWRTRSWSLRSS